jgi:F420-non-reducing hydrogenase iron-sulfur subunit
MTDQTKGGTGDGGGGDQADAFEPVIVGFFCNWCTASAADLAGTSRMQYPPNVRPVRVMCTGSVDTSFVLRALLEGADGVLVGGCHPGDCHYVSGNYRARRRLSVVTRTLDALGLEPDRFRFEWISASEGARFADVVTEFTEQLRKMGPSPLKEL